MSREAVIDAPSHTLPLVGTSIRGETTNDAQSTMSVANDSRKQRLWTSFKSFVSGGCGGACLAIVGHPLDLIKVRMQTASSANGAAANSSAGALLVRTLRTEGLLGLYRGVSAPLAGATPLYAVYFWGYDIGKSCVRWWEESIMNKPPIESFTVGQLSIAGGISAIPASFVMAPMERVKCLLQIQQQQQQSVGMPPKYKGMVDCARQVYQEGGIRSVYKGTVATLLRDVPGSMVWFGVYEWIKREMSRNSNAALSPSAVLTAGGIAGIINWVVAIPPDVLKSRFQTAPEGMYSGLYDVYKDLMAKEGFGALYKGVGPAMLRAFPANAACFFGMEVATTMLSYLDSVFE